MTSGPYDDLKLSAQLCFALYSTMLGVNKAYRGFLKKLKITYPQYLVFLVLWEKDGQNVSEICEKLYLETPTLTPLLKRMEAQGFLTRQRLARDERQVIVSLTPAGWALRDEAKDIPRCMANAMGCGLDELEAMRGQLDRLRDRLMAS